MRRIVAVLILFLTSVQALGQRIIKPNPEQAPQKLLRGTPPLVEKAEVPKRDIPKQPAVQGERPLPPRIFKRLHLADAVTLASKYARPQARFLWLGDAADEQALQDLHKLCAGHLNHLSVETDLVVPQLVPGSDGQLLVLQPQDYGEHFVQSWEKLGDADPYFHVVVEQQEVKFKWVVWPGGVWPKDGRFYPARAFQYQVPVQVGDAVKTAKLAPWLAKDQKAVAALLEKTDSDVPIISGQWFLWQTAAAQDRSPGYYDFIGVKKIADLELLAGFDQKLMTASRRKEILEAVSRSGVAQQPRRIASFPTYDNLRLWRTFDSKVATEKHNPLRVLDSDNFLYDASEIFFGLPNGLWGVGLFGSDGSRQNTAPDFVGPDTTSTTNDGRIHAIISCIRCHYPNAGLNPIDAWSRNLFKPPLKLYSTDPEVFRDLRQKYLKDLEGPLQWNREQFSRTLHQITGMKPAEYAEAFTRFWAGYDGFLGLERAAREMSTTEAVFRDALLGFLKANGYLDTVLGGFLRGQEIPRRQWLEVYAQAQEIVRVYGGGKRP